MIGQVVQDLLIDLYPSSLVKKTKWDPWSRRNEEFFELSSTIPDECARILREYYVETGESRASSFMSQRFHPSPQPQWKNSLENGFLWMSKKGGLPSIHEKPFTPKNVEEWSKQAWKLVDEVTEAFQYFLLKASNQLAQEKGKCDYFERTKYADGILPIDTYKKDVDNLVKRKLSYDWTNLRKTIKQHGLRHSTLSAQMPSESSSVVSNATNGIEPPRDYLSVKKSKKGTLKQIVPDYNRLKNFYTLLWDMPDNDGYINIVAVMQKYFDQAISGNWSYNPENYEGNEVPLSVMAKDLLNTYKLGWKTSYYQNTYDGKTDIEEPTHSVGWHDNVEEKKEEIDDPENCEACTI